MQLVVAVARGSLSLPRDFLRKTNLPSSKVGIHASILESLLKQQQQLQNKLIWFSVLVFTDYCLSCYSVQCENINFHTEHYELLVAFLQTGRGEDSLPLLFLKLNS